MLARPKSLHELKEDEICSAYQILSWGKHSEVCEFSAGFGMHIPVCRNAEVSFLELFVAFLVSWIKTWSIWDIEFHKGFYKSQWRPVLKDRLDTSTTDQTLEYMLCYCSCPKINRFSAG